MDIKSTHETDLRNQSFIDLSVQFQNTLRTVGIEIVPYRDAELKYFSQMQISLQEKLLQSLAVETEIILDLVRSGINPVRCEKQLTLAFLRRTGLEPPSDLVLHLEDGDFVAIYNREQQMIFLSPNHLTWMSYTLEDLLCRPWYQIFHRNEMIEKVLRERAASLLSVESQDSIINFDIPPHIVSEIDSPERREVTCRSKLYSPLFRAGKPAGFLALNNGTGVTSKAMPR